METIILVSAKLNSKPGQVTIKIHLNTDKKKKNTEFSKYVWDLKAKTSLIIV